jgi:capsule polysaccharide export protein KpsE/RkpR
LFDPHTYVEDNVWEWVIGLQQDGSNIVNGKMDRSHTPVRQVTHRATDAITSVNEREQEASAFLALFPTTKILFFLKTGCKLEMQLIIRSTQKIDKMN